MSNWGAPQFIAALVLCIIALASFLCDGKPKENWSFGGTSVELLMWIALLSWGGFFR